MKYLTPVFLLVMSGCATIFKGTSDTIHVSSNPAGASVYVDGANMGSATNSVVVKKSLNPQTLVLKSDGYKDQALLVQRSFDPVSLFNIFFWPGFIVDAASGALMKAERNNYVVELEKK